MLMENIELEPVSPFSNRQPCFQLSHLIVGVRRSLFWSTRLLQKSKGGRNLQLVSSTSCWRLHSTDDLEQWWSSLFWGRDEKPVSIYLTVKYDTFPPTPWNCNSIYNIERSVSFWFTILSTLCLQTNQNFDFEFEGNYSQVFKNICAMWSVHNLESANTLWRIRRGFWKQDVYFKKLCCAVWLVFIGV